jgi:asparagine synthase (glutamine-hydrolysing)
MPHFLLLSSSDAIVPTELEEVARRSLRERLDVDAPTVERGDGWTLFTDGRPAVALAESRAWHRFGGPTHELVEGDLPPSPPGSALRIDADRSGRTALEARTDPFGLGHVYHGQGPGLALVGSSSRVLADVLGAGIDVAALGVVARLGHLLANDTVFAGIHKLDASERVVLSAGRSSVERLPRPAVQELFANVDEAVAAGVGVVRACVARVRTPIDSSGALPALELSGGFDSRLVLAAIPRDERRLHTALTLGTKDSDDVRIARQLARREGMEHEVLDLAGLEQLEDDAVAARVVEAARAREFGSNPVAAAVLGWVNRGLHDRVRISGQNGEEARGFYHPGQAERTSWDRSAVEGLVRGRLFVNDSIDVDWIDPRLRACFDGRVRDRLESLLVGPSWLAATDHYYVFGREQRWIGAGMSHECHRRSFRMPLFDPEFHAWATRLPTPWRTGGRVLARVLAELDPGLAALPLDSGLTVHDLFEDRASARLQRLRVFAGKVRRKLLQRFRRSARPQVGAAVLAAAATRTKAWHEALDTCREAGLLGPDSTPRPTPPTVGFVLNVATLCRDHGVRQLVD